MTKYLLLITICLFLTISCNKIDVPKKLNAVLTLAGNNRNELIKTIKHFQNAGDSLKLQAAYYLIENLENKYSYNGEPFTNLQEIITSFRLDTVSNMESLKRAKDSICSVLTTYNSYKYQKTADVQTISSQYLIDYINDSFQTMELPWVKGKINFDQFCKYVLPYKVGDEPVENWRAAILQDYRRLLDSLSRTQTELLEVAKRMNTEVARQFETRGVFKNSVNFGYQDLKRMKVGSCYNGVTYTIYVMRALGIPICLDLIPIWGNRSGAHQWAVIQLPGGKTVPFDPTYEFKSFNDRFDPQINRINPPPKGSVPAKIYRISNEIRESKYSRQEDVYSFFKQSIIDVTDQYVSVSEIKMQFYNIPSIAHYVYLFVTDAGFWCPAQVFTISSDSSDKTVYFKKICRGIVYLPGYLDKDSVYSLDYPFVQNKKGEIRKFIPRKDKLVQMVLTRKYPLSERMISYADRMRGGIFQASNSPDFLNPTLLYSVSKTPEPYYQDIIINKEGAYRYFRYLSPDSCYGDVADIEVYSNSSKAPIYGKILGTKGMSDLYSSEKAFDQNIQTYYNSSNPNGNWVGMDFGKQIKINKIRYIPRNDQNTIECGDDYELLFWDNRWITLGIQKAKTQYLKYSAPANALLWLRNIGKGKEERIFTFENGKQVWW